MQPAPDKDDSESLFDFLDGDQINRADNSGESIADDRNNGRRRRVESAGENNAEKPFPIIRKPVSVSETGPLKAPRPGDPVEPPPALTDSIRTPDTTRSPNTPKKPRRVAQQAGADVPELDLDELDLDFGPEEWPSSDNWTDKSYRPVPVNYQPERTSLARKAGYVLAFTLIACGAGYALIGVPAVKQWTDSAIASARETINGLSGNAQQSATLTTDTVLDPVFESGDAPAVGDTLTAADSSAPKTLNELFREQLAELEVLMQSGSLDAAEQAIEDMDRSVYGYGAPEFTEIKERIAGLRQGDIVELDQAPQTNNVLEEDPLTEQQRVQQEASQLEQEELARAERQAAEAAQAELVQQQQRDAELAAEQERAAAEAEALRQESERAEQQRIDQENERARIQQAELERAAAEAAQIRADRTAQEQARQEQLALALQERAQLDQQVAPEQSAAADTYNPDDWQAVTPSGSTDDSVQQLAARQREAARQQRLIEAQQREEQTAGSLPPNAVVPDTVVALAEPELVPVPEPVAESSGPTPITDADLQQVYGQFAQLQNAIESRDINTVIALTQRSGARIQQVMQMFENNVAITARLRNVSTLDAAGEIQGTLQITRLERADGAVTGPPQNFSSVRLSSVRDGDGWSAIGW